MPAFSLPRLARQSGIRRASVTLRPIAPTAAAATDLAAIMATAWRVWAESIESILAEYDPKPLATDGFRNAAPNYARDYAEALTLDSPSQIEATIAAVAAEFLTRLVTEITPGLRRWTVRQERWHRSKWAAAVKAGTAIDLSTVLTAQPVEETLQAFIARNVALVRNVSEQAQQRIADAVFRGYQNRTPSRELAKELREAVDMGRQRAQRIAIDQSSKLSAALDTERMAEAGIALFKWRHSGKLHPRLRHKARDGKIYELKSGKARDGGGTIPADDRPGMQPYCGCRAQAYLAIMDEIA